MAGALTTASTLQCPHGGQVQIVSSNTKVTADAALATSADTFTISGCPFQLPTPVPVPSPCVLVQWLVPDKKVTVGGNATLSDASSGLCLAATGVPQGPVQVASTQSAVKTQ